MNGATEAIAEPKGNVRITMPAIVLVLLLTWAASALVTYGVISTRIDWLAQRVDNLEKAEGAYIPRPEYDSALRDMTSRLDRIERKIDELK